eukprot:9044965-Ditylum_brightwellii.AAC.1
MIHGYKQPKIDRFKDGFTSVAKDTIEGAEKYARIYLLYLSVRKPSFVKALKYSKKGVGRQKPEDLAKGIPNQYPGYEWTFKKVKNWSELMEMMTTLNEWLETKSHYHQDFVSHDHNRPHLSNTYKAMK